MKFMLRMTTEGQNNLMLADVNGDGKIGLPEMIYILQKVAVVR
jgi:hypothetical protein